MPGFLISPKADDDILRLWQRLYANASIETANRIEAELYSTFDDLAKTPGQGHQRKDLTAHNVLFFAIYSYLVVYRVGDPIEIVRVLNGKRNLTRMLVKPF